MKSRFTVLAMAVMMMAGVITLDAKWSMAQTKISGANVVLSGVNAFGFPVTLGSTTTDANGYFGFINASDGSYVLKAYSSSGLEATANVTASGGLIEGEVVDNGAGWEFNFDLAPPPPPPAPEEPIVYKNAEEKAKTEKLAELSGASAREIAGMRASGMGWGEIAKALGVDPSALGGKNGKK